MGPTEPTAIVQFAVERELAESVGAATAHALVRNWWAGGSVSVQEVCRCGGRNPAQNAEICQRWNQSWLTRYRAKLRSAS